MNARQPLRSEYSYTKTTGAPGMARLATHILAQRASLARRVQPLYKLAGSPFGTSDRGLWLWVDFGRRSHSN